VSKLILRSKMEMLKSMMRTSKRRSDKPLGEGVGPPRDAGKRARGGT